MTSITLPTKPEELTILFVGSNPSIASETDVAFHSDTKSSRILSDWTKDIKGMKIHINVVNKKTDNNRPLKKSEIKESIVELADTINSIKPHRIVALGKTATTALTLLRLDFLEMPHPSGCNRKLNDHKFVEEKVKSLTQFCNQVRP